MSKGFRSLNAVQHKFDDEYHNDYIHTTNSLPSFDILFWELMELSRIELAVNTVDNINYILLIDFINYI